MKQKFGILGCRLRKLKERREGLRLIFSHWLHIALDFEAEM